MGEGIVSTKEDLQRTLDLVTKSLKIPEKEVIEIKKRTQMALNILIQNERKIWLRTREGREMLVDFGRAAAGLLRAAEHLAEAKTSDQESLEDFLRSVGGVELCANKLEEESRRRGMVVT